MKQYTLGLYEKAMPKELTWAKRLESAREAGFDGLEVSIDETDERLERLDWDQDARSALKKAAQEAGVELMSICLSAHRKYPIGSADAKTCTRGMEIMLRAVDFAKDLSIPIIQLAGYDVYYEASTPETVARFASNLKLCAQMAAKRGVLLGFETMETPFMDTVQKAMHFVRQVDSPYLHVYPDMGNLTNASLLYGVDVPDDMQTGAGRLIAAHIKETIPGHYREIPFTTGHVNFARDIASLWTLGVRRYVTELWYTSNPAWREDIAFAAALARRYLDRQA